MEPDDPRREWLPRRQGDRPRTTPDDPHRQLTQIAPVELQDALVERGRLLSGTFVAPSMISMPGARAFVLDDSTPTPFNEVFMIGREYAHIHPSYDGSLHMVLPAHLVLQVVERGWGEQHPVAKMGLIPMNTLMVYGPRNPEELDVVFLLLKTSWSHARGQ
jgi:phospholipase/carboxylesterase